MIQWTKLEAGKMTRFDCIVASVREKPPRVVYIYIAPMSIATSVGTHFPNALCYRGSDRLHSM